MDTCIFCAIVARTAESSIYYEDDFALGFLDINPINDGHALIIPKQHVVLLADLEENLGKHLFTLAQRTAAALRKTNIRCEGVNLFLADGEAAFQEVFHLHLHVFPRFKGDSFTIQANWDYRPAREHLAHIAHDLRQNM
jgi:histidine triad (HIT) family protein